MLRFLSWAALLLGHLILAAYALIYVELIKLASSFGSALLPSAVENNLHLLIGPAVGLTLVIAGAWGIARARPRP